MELSYRGVGVSSRANAFSFIARLASTYRWVVFMFSCPHHNVITMKEVARPPQERRRGVTPGCGERHALVTGLAKLCIEDRGPSSLRAARRLH